MTINESLRKGKEIYLFPLMSSAKDNKLIMKVIDEAKRIVGASNAGNKLSGKEQAGHPVLSGKDIKHKAG